MNDTEIEKDWRGNIIETLQYLFIKDYPYGIPTVIYNAIDAAYVAGLDDGKAEENKEWREGRRCAICGEPKSINLAEMCGDCFKNE